MGYRTGLEIKKAILAALREGEMKLKQLERRTGADSRTLERHLSELEFLGFVEIDTHAKSEWNGQPYRVVRLKRTNW